MRKVKSASKKIGVEKVFQTFEEREREGLAWLNRPRVHTAIFEKVRQDEENVRLAKKFKASTTVLEAVQRQQAESAKRLAELAKTLPLSKRRFNLFKQLVVEYRRMHSIELYVELRRQFPEVEIQVGRLGGLDPLFSLENEFKKAGIDPILIASAMDADEPSVDALCLRLLDLLVDKSRLPKSGVGYIQKRRAAISDTIVNYLIAVILEGLDWHDVAFRVPASLVVLIRHQITGPNPDLHTTFQSRERRRIAAMMVGQKLALNERPSVRTLARLAGVPISTAGRWLADNEFAEWMAEGRRLADGDFPGTLRSKGRPGSLKRLTKK
jgi:hypothetical protein